MSLYKRKIITKMGCGRSCEGCEWEEDVAPKETPTGYSYSWRVTRSNCTMSPFAEYWGSTAVPWGETGSQLFYCDAAGECPGFELLFTAPSKEESIADSGK